MARRSRGSLLLRIEDTDRQRSTPENVDQILDALRWLELDFDEGPLSQFERRDHHLARIDELLESGAAYRDPASSEEVRAQRGERGGAGYRGTPRDVPGAAIRLRVPDDGETVVEDLIRGEVRFENRLQDDLVIARGDGTPLYNFAVAVDDAEMGITDVIRGDDHLSNAPKQLLVLRAIGAEPPRYAHLPLLHGPDGRKLSKRHGAASVQELRASGYLPAAVRNYLALLGWGTTDDVTVLSTEELVERFRIERVGRSSAVFDERKLRWLNGRFMRGLELAEYERRLAAHLSERDPTASQAFAAAPVERRRAACEIVQEKAQTLEEVWRLIAFLFAEPVDDRRAWDRVMAADAIPGLERALVELRAVEAFDPVALERALGGAADELRLKPKQLYQPLRLAITGTTVSPGIFESLAVLGRERSVARVDAALSRLRAEAGMRVEG